MQSSILGSMKIIAIISLSFLSAICCCVQAQGALYPLDIYPNRQFFAAAKNLTLMEQSPDGKVLRDRLTVYGEENDDYSFVDTFWDVETRSELPQSNYADLFLSQKTLSAQDGIYCVLDRETGERVLLKNAKVNVYWPTHQFSRDGKKLTILNKGFVTTWDTESGLPLHQAPYVGGGSINDVGSRISPDRKRLLTLWPKDFLSPPLYSFRVNLIRSQTGEVVAILPAHFYRDLMFSPDSRVIRTVNERKFREGKNLSQMDSRYEWIFEDTRFFDTETGRLLWQLPEKQVFADVGQFSPDGKLYGRIGWTGLEIYESFTGRLLGVLPKIERGELSRGWFENWTFSFDNKGIWAGDKDNLIWYWPLPQK